MASPVIVSFGSAEWVKEQRAGYLAGCLDVFGIALAPRRTRLVYSAAVRNGLEPYKNEVIRAALSDVSRPGGRMRVYF